MCRMLIDNVKIILKLYQPVSVKQLSDQLVAASGFRCKKPFLKKFQLFGLFSGDGVCRGDTGTESLHGSWDETPLDSSDALNMEVFVLKTLVLSDVFGVFCVAVFSQMFFSFKVPENIPPLLCKGLEL